MDAMRCALGAQTACPPAYECRPEAGHSMPRSGTMPDASQRPRLAGAILVDRLARHAVQATPCKVTLDIAVPNKDAKFRQFFVGRLSNNILDLLCRTHMEWLLD